MCTHTQFVHKLNCTFACKSFVCMCYSLEQFGTVCLCCFFSILQHMYCFLVVYYIKC